MFHQLRREISLKNRLFLILLILISQLVWLPNLQGMPLSPGVIEQLRQSGEIQRIADRMIAAKARGVCQALDRSGKHGQPALSLDASAVDTFRVIVILVDFTDNQASAGNVFGQIADFQHLLFSTDTTDDDYSMSEFYYENSYGNFVLQGTVVGWYRLPQTYAYYVDGQNGFGSYPMNAQRMAEDAVNMANPSVDFAQFDNDGNGWCDGVFVVHSGAGAESTSSDDMIWSHAWSMSTVLNLDGVNVSSYTTEPEELSATGLITMGVFAHEYGHFLGLPDLYDTDYSSSGIGDWSLMAGGSWNLNGRHPAFLDAWCKKELGYLTPTNITSNQVNVDVASSYYNPVAFRVWENGAVGNEYFLVENRQKIANDLGIDGSGLLIYHIDENIGGNWDETHPLVAVEQADGLFQLESGASDGDANDLWSALTKNAFTDLSTPNTRKYNLQKTKTAVWDISAPDSIMTTNFDISYSRPLFAVTSGVFSDAAFGNNNGVIEAGETMTFSFSLTNAWLTAANVTGSMTSDNSEITFSTPSVNIGTVAGEGGLGDNNGSPIVFDIPLSFDPCIDSFYLEISSDNPYGGTTVGFELHIGIPEVLIVDDDGGDNWQSHLTGSLQRLRVPHDVYDKSVMGSPSAATLADYSIVMWLTGDDRPNILSVADVAAMSDFMDNGGKLFLTGQSIVGQLSVSNPSFVSDYLKTSYVADLLFPFINGVAGAPIGGGIKVRYDSFTNQTKPQKMAVLGGATLEFNLQVGGDMGLSYSGDYRLVLFSFGFEGISNNYTTSGFANQDTVLARIIKFFDYGDVNKFSNPNVDTVSIPGETSVSRVVNHTPLLTWSYSDSTFVAITAYHVEVGSGALCYNTGDIWDSGVINGADSSIVYGGDPLQDGQSYYLRVRVYNGTDWSSWRRISFQMNSAPTTPNLVGPKNDTTVNITTPDLTLLQASDADIDPLSYIFEIYDDALLTQLVSASAATPSQGSSTSWTVDVPLAENEDYFWRARSTDGYENSTFSSAASFMVAPAGCCVGIRGNVDDIGGEPGIDIADLLYMVDYQFGNPPGPAPVCAEEGDVDGSSNTDIADLLYLVDYQFGNPSGPAPVACP